jgi:hypothetical protein
MKTPNNEKLYQGYSLSFDFYTKLKPTAKFQFLNHQIVHNGFYIIKYNNHSYKVLNPALAFIFICDEPLTVTNTETKIEEQVTGRSFFNAYLDGHNEGVDYFKANYTPSVDTMYGSNATKFVHDLHLHYFHTDHEKTYEGWKGFAIDNYPLLLNSSLMYKYGYYTALINGVNELRQKYPNQFKNFEKCVEDNAVSSIAPPTAIIAAKPTLVPEHIPTIYGILKDFFSTEEQELLLHLITTGENVKTPLMFKDNGNRLADTFKQLKKADIITGCQQKDLEQWILTNFTYQHRGHIKTFTSRYLNDIISTSYDKCQKPLINVKINPTRITKA